ncbi:MAG: AmmeMemoRadiSam system protein A [Calditrichaeota bacterium]|nr:MAG: AmmeMemoRadiSam system protein A [Calditrichota bacterium]
MANLLPDDQPLCREDKKKLLDLARDSIGAVLQGKSVPEMEAIPSLFMEKRGVFVSLHRGGKLRGCIGYVLPYEPLIIAVQEMAQSAALRDPRFDPMTWEELSDCVIEISVLSPLKRIINIEEIIVGIHGLFVKKGFHSGLLLPQVAEQYHWTRIQFLQQTCLKAGLSLNAWQDEGTEISIYSAQVFSDEEG